MKYLHVPLSDHAHEIVEEIKFILELRNKADTVEKALEIAYQQLMKEGAKSES